MFYVKLTSIFEEQPEQILVRACILKLNPPRRAGAGKVIGALLHSFLSL
jgi:hypothetical protein